MKIDTSIYNNKTTMIERIKELFEIYAESLVQSRYKRQRSHSAKATFQERAKSWADGMSSGQRKDNTRLGVSFFEDRRFLVSTPNAMASNGVR